MTLEKVFRDRTASPASPAGTIQTEADGIAIPAPAHETSAGHLPYADPHALQACRTRRKRHDRTDSTAPDDVRTSPC
jgi:hypothetical protein